MEIKGRPKTDSNPALQKLYLNTSLLYRKTKIPIVICTALFKLILIQKTKNDKTHQSNWDEEQQECDPVFCHFYIWRSVFYVVIELTQTAMEKNIGKKLFHESNSWWMTSYFLYAVEQISGSPPNFYFT